MSGTDAIRLDGTVIQVLPNGLFRVELSNRHLVLAHAARRDREKLGGLNAGSQVRLEMTPFDMSCGRIMF
jgi:translation initiation factor IF-1